MRAFILIALSLCLLMAGEYCQAQAYPCGGPGPGEVVVGQTQGGQGVASVPLCQRVDQRSAQSPQAPAPKWESRWGAIATDGDKGVIGSSSGSASRAVAEHTAMTDCQSKGGAPCKLQVSYANGCGALVVGDKAFDADWGSTKEEAIGKATKVCSAESANCHAYFTTCSLPDRVR